MLKQSPLDAAHRALGAKMVPFGGWDMPVQYPSGTLAEHRSCRSDAVVFDVSHLGTLRAEGPGAFTALQGALTNDLRKIAPGRAQYTHLLDAADGSVLDDIIVWWVSDQRFDVMPNASNTDRAAAALAEVDTPAWEAVDVTSTRAVLAVQGPNARTRIESFWPLAASVKRFRVAEVGFDGAPCVVAGTGYTGEDGLEIAVPAAAASTLWRALLDAGVVPAGLGARDTLRLEAGLPLHGHELGPGITPLQAGLGWVVSWDKGPFRGRDALQRERERGVARLLRGLQVPGRRPPRADQLVSWHGRGVGTVTSGNFSPVLEQGIALALLDTAVPLGAEVTIDVRGTDVAATVVDPPFVRKG